MPNGQEDLARQFYVEALGLTEVEKPLSLADRGGCWFRAFDSDGRTVADVHLGIDDPFVPAKKAHPALICESLATLEAVAVRIEVGGFDLSWAERDTLEGFIRFHARDGFGKRIEVVTPA